jgi:hypothetical protein
MKAKLIGALSCAVLVSPVALATTSDGWYPGPIVDASASLKTRSQVVAELRAAERFGLLHIGGEGDVPRGTAEQEMAVAAAGGQGGNFSIAKSKSREQVVAELREAQRLGVLHIGGEGDVPQATPQQEALIAMAGARAAAGAMVASK